MRIVVCILLSLALFAPGAFAASQPVGSLWGGIWHLTKADGSQVDCLDVGLNDSSITSFAGLTFSVTGPGGFTYTFAPSDTEYFEGAPEQYHEFPSLAPGVYTFSLNDASGNLGKVADTHAPTASLPRVDTATVQYRRNFDGTYLFTWATVNDTRSYYYRLVIFRQDTGEAVYFGRAAMASADTPVTYYPDGMAHNPLQDGVTYLARVEVLGGPTFELRSNRSNSAFVTFTPAPGDFDPGRQSIDYAAVYNRVESNDAIATDLSLGLTTPAGVTSVSVTGPNSFSYTYDLVADRDPDPVWPELYKKFTPALTPGLYTFHVVANGAAEQKAYANLTAPVSYPAPDSATYQAEDRGDGYIRFSWASVNWTGALYYRIYVDEPSTGRSVLSSRTNKTFVDVPASELAGLVNPRWRVEVCDSNSFTTQRNRRVGAFLPLSVQPYDPGRPEIYASIATVTNYDGSATAQLYMETWSGAGPITAMTQAGPAGYQRDVFDPSGSIDFLEPVTPAPGLYSFTSTGPTGTSITRYHYLPARHAIPPVDYRTVHVNRENWGYITLSWAPVASDLPLWYAVEFYDATDVGADGKSDPVYLPVNYYNQGTSLCIPESVLPTGPFMFRIFAFDGGNGTTYNNYSRSVMVGYGGPGFDYAALTDADGDGYASNVDADDANPAVNPFPYPKVTAFTLPASSTGLTVPITTFNAIGTVAGWCVTETNSSASCNWQNTAPANHTFAAAGSQTLYAFVKSVTGNISAAATATTVIGHPLTLGFAGSGAGGVTGAMVCTKGGSCSPGSFAPGSQVTLTAAPGTDSLFGGWSGDCAVSGAVCVVTMNGSRSVTARFDPMPSVWLAPGTSAASYFSGLRSAYLAGAADATIKAKAVTLVENLLLDRAIGVTIEGGYGAGYLSRASRTVLQGTLKVRDGKLTVNGMAVR